MSSTRWERSVSAVLLVFGVAFPVAALVAESMLGLSGDTFFDPIPTPWHILLVTSVAAANAWAWFVAVRERKTHLRWAAFANGAAIGVAAFYTLLFLPILPISIIGIVFFGLGLLAWAPVLSLIAALRLRIHLSRFAAHQNVAVRSWPGLVLGLTALIALDVPVTVTRIGAQMATSEASGTRLRGLQLLRVLGSEEALLRMCYVRRGAMSDPLAFLMSMQRPIDIGTARELFYRVTGRSFNSVPAPEQFRRSGRFFFDGGFDFEQGGEVVGGRMRDLFLASSALDGSVDADAALGYLEWTLVFRNASQIQREARTQIALPPGAVVSRVTLWIAGEEREAAFAGRRQVTQAYQAVVRQSRDPVLVTSAGVDRIAMQLFPVPAAGEMKVRIGMTVPLTLPNAREGLFRMPYFHERNFDVREGVRHSVWIESTAKLRSALAASADGATFRMQLADGQLSGEPGTIVVTRGARNVAWSGDMHSAGQIVRQAITTDDTTSRLRLLILVVDGSASMQGVATEIASRLATLPSDVRIQLLFAHDAHDAGAPIPSIAPAVAAEEIASFDYAGGHDNTAALVRALDLDVWQPHAVLLWIHGPQPVLLDTEEALLQRLSRGTAPTRWYELQIAPGRNLVAEKLDGLATLESLRREDLGRMVAAWRSGERRMVAVRERIEASAGAMPVSERTSDHLVRLWANDEVLRLVRAGHEQRPAAIQLAQQYQLVTPVSGAVVLETRQQYDAAGLQPVPEGSVPSIPEPEEWALIMVALAALAYAYTRGRRPYAPRLA